MMFDFYPKALHTNTYTHIIWTRTLVSVYLLCDYSKAKTRIYANAHWLWACIIL